MFVTMNNIMRYATKWQVNSAQWQRLGLMSSDKFVALKAQVKNQQHNQINLGFQPAISIPIINPRRRYACHWAEIVWAFSPQNQTVTLLT